MKSPATVRQGKMLAAQVDTVAQHINEGYVISRLYPNPHSRLKEKRQDKQKGCLGIQLVPHHRIFFCSYIVHNVYNFIHSQFQ